jgi:hypothetical protein
MPTWSLPLRVKLAWIVAIVFDLLQWALFPFMVEGAASPLVDALDLVACLILVFLLGWHWVFLPSAAVELLPAADLAPTWMLAVYWVTKKGGSGLLK